MAKVISDFKNIDELEKSFENSNEPSILVKDNTGRLVVMSPSEYEKQLYDEKLYKGLKQAEEDVENGRVSDAYVFITELRQRYGF